MIGTITAQLALFAFGVAILAGLIAGNSVTTVLSRALLCMFAAMLAGQLVARAARLILRDHFAARKNRIDQSHAEQVKAIDDAADQNAAEDNSTQPVQ